MGGAQIVFRCNSGYIPAGRMSATCRSPDGISVLGTWTPDPADLVCNGEIKKCESYTIHSDLYITWNEIALCMTLRLL